MPEVAPLTAAASGDTEVASRGAIAETCMDALISRSGDGGTRDANAARLDSGIDDKDAIVVAHDSAAACVDSNTGVGAIGPCIYPATVSAATGDIADCVLVGAADDDIATGAAFLHRLGCRALRSR